MIFLLLDGVLLWLFLLVIFGSLLFTVETDKPGWCSFTFACGLLGLQFFSPYHPLSYIVHNPVYSLVILLAYVCAGVVWLLIKWHSYTDLLKTAYREYKAKWTIEHPSGSTADFEYSAKNKFGVKVPTNKSSDSDYWAFVGEHKSSIYLWFMFWPLSFIGTFFDDPFRRIWRFVYSKVSSTLVGIAKKAFGKL